MWVLYKGWERPEQRCRPPAILALPEVDGNFWSEEATESLKFGHFAAGFAFPYEGLKARGIGPGADYVSEFCFSL
ncbi:MAG: hypothetical protein ACPLRW_04640 [Moorellales bacterium]